MHAVKLRLHYCVPMPLLLVAINLYNLFSVVGFETICHFFDISGCVEQNAKVLGILAEYQTVVDNRPANRGRIVVPVAVPARETARTDLTQSAAAAAAAALLFDDDTSRMS
jgi:hypothetical protein